MNFKKLLFAVLVLGLMALIYRFSTHPVVLKTLFPEKIWAHRVNSLEKLEETAKLFSGVELDVVWEENHFDVNHPPAKSIDLNLADYFKNIKEKKELGIWLDFKNLNKNNAESAFNNLDSLVGAFDIQKQNIILESREPQYLKVFKERGYLTSYYLPSAAGNAEEKYRLIKGIQEKLDTTFPDFISSSLGEYVYIKKDFPEENKILWHLGELKSLKNKCRIYKALLDNKVKIILLPYKSEKGDR